MAGNRSTGPTLPTEPSTAEKSSTSTNGGEEPLDSADPGERSVGSKVREAFGPATWPRALALAVAVAFLAGAVTWTWATRDPLSEVDQGFMQDMDWHHSQAIEMSLLLLDKPEVDPMLKHYAQEIVVGQRFEQGIFNATLARWGHPADGGPDAMGWMGQAVPKDQMSGMATEEQMQSLAEAEGTDAEVLWIALMTEHHLGGLHMADWAARYGRDETVRNLARSMVTMQRAEVIDIDRYRRSADLPLADGFSDPLQDQRLNPLTFTELVAEDD